MGISESKQMEEELHKSRGEWALRAQEREAEVENLDERAPHKIRKGEPARETHFIRGC
ncbi:MAG: hypothetical protein R6U38_06005 [Desulfatiglandaceae bacterium]